MSSIDTDNPDAVDDQPNPWYIGGLLVLSGMFAFSVLAKLHDLREFEVILVRLHELFESRLLRQVVSRSVVGIELVLAFGLWLPGVARRLVLGLSAAFLFVLTIGMFYLHIQGEAGNCGCFGSVVEMTPLMAALKNIPFMILTLVLMWHAPNASRLGYPLPAMILVVAVGVVFGLPLRHPPEAKPIPPVPVEQPLAGTDTAVVEVGVDSAAIPVVTTEVTVKPPPPSPFAGFTGFQPEDIDITTGEVFVAFVSLECEHCQELVRELSMRRMGLPAPLVLVCLGDESELPTFRRTTDSDFPWLMADTLDFLDMIGDAPPRLYLLRAGQPLRVWDGEHIDADIVIAEATDLVGAK